MKRFHMHVAVDNLEQSIRFYSALFGAEPAKLKPDYAKWMLDDPRINFAISTRGAKPGLDHVGLQVDDVSELEVLRAQLAAANIATRGDGEATCCYARSEKSWVQDPSGIAWEAYHTMADAALFNDHAQAPLPQTAADKPQTASCGTSKSGCC
jgi:catechol 2,3-dioxygenase-like lactoylglutathione lyase family enzyme